MIIIKKKFWLPQKSWNEININFQTTWVKKFFIIGTKIVELHIARLTTAYPYKIPRYTNYISSRRSRDTSTTSGLNKCQKPNEIQLPILCKKFCTTFWFPYDMKIFIAMGAQKRACRDPSAYTTNYHCTESTGACTNCSPIDLARRWRSMRETPHTGHIVGKNY